MCWEGYSTQGPSNFTTVARLCISLTVPSSNSSLPAPITCVLYEKCVVDGLCYSSLKSKGQVFPFDCSDGWQFTNNGRKIACSQPSAPTPVKFVTTVNSNDISAVQVNAWVLTSIGGSARPIEGNLVIIRRDSSGKPVDRPLRGSCSQY